MKHANRILVEIQVITKETDNKLTWIELYTIYLDTFIFFFFHTPYAPTQSAMLFCDKSRSQGTLLNQIFMVSHK